MGKVKFVPNNAGFRELRTRQQTQTMISNLASSISSSASGMGIETEVKTHISGGNQGRAWASIYPSGSKSRIKNLKDNSMLKALGSVRK